MRYENRVRRLRFEHWPEQAADYLLQLLADRESHFPIVVGPTLADSILGLVDAELARRVLGEAGLRALLQTLMSRVETDRERAALRWIEVLTFEDPSEGALLSLAAPGVATDIRRLAATRLLEGDCRPIAAAALREIVQNDPDQAPAAAQALLAAGEHAGLDYALLRDLALLADHADAPEAIAVLLQAGDQGVALPAALHLLVMHHRRFYGGPDPRWRVVESLMEYGYAQLGLAAARWLALRPDCSSRMEACEALLEVDQIESTIPLLQYLAFESYGEAGQRACERLLALRETARVQPLFLRAERKADPALRYQACLSLALANGSVQPEVAQNLTELRVALWNERFLAYQASREAFSQVGLLALGQLEPADEREREAQALGRYSLERWAGLMSQAGGWESLLESLWPAVSVNGARFALQEGQVERARRRLVALLVESRAALSMPVRMDALQCLGRIVGPQTTEVLVRVLENPAGELSYAAAGALGRLGDAGAVPQLIAALGAQESMVRRAAARALGGLGDLSAVPQLIALLGDEESHVRQAAAEALGGLGDPSSVSHLVAALGDQESMVRRAAAEALGGLGDRSSVPQLIAALGDQESMVRRAAAEALVELGDPSAVPHLVAALRDEESNVRQVAAEALGRLGDPSAVPHLVAALRDEEWDVRGAAASTLSRK